MTGLVAHTRVARAIADARASDRAALVVYLPAGYPDMDTSLACLRAAVAAGADVLEVGFPYSDPLMDGPVIQAACQTALEAGYTPADDFEMCAQLTASVDAPVLVMTYYNVVWRYPGAQGVGGVTPFAEAAAASGLSGAILPDLPAEESEPWQQSAARADLATVFLASSTTADARLGTLAAASTGFVYATATLGVTGVRSSVSDNAQGLVERLRSVTDGPICVGIGVSSPEQVREVAGFADGVIVGSAAVRAAGAGGAGAVGEFVADLAEACRTPRP